MIDIEPNATGLPGIEQLRTRRTRVDYQRPYDTLGDPEVRPTL